MTETKPMRTKRRKQPRLHEIRLQLRKNKLAVVSLFVLIALFSSGFARHRSVFL